MTSREGLEPLLSVVVAARNEEHCLVELFGRLEAAIAAERCRAEFVLVDDGSTDATAQVMNRFAAGHDERIVVRLPHNVGHQRALVDGMKRASGDVVLTLDADLQHPPECLRDMLGAWRSGFDVVHMQRRTRDEAPPIRAALRAAFYVLFNALSDVHVSAESTDFRLVDRAALPSLLQAWEERRFLRAAARAASGRHTALPFDAGDRFADESKYTTISLSRLALRIVYSAAASRRHASRDVR